MLNIPVMPAGAESQSRVLSGIPADIDTALARADWRRNAAWPLNQRESNEIAAGQVRRALGWVNSLDDRLARDVVLLALPNILAYGRAIVITALAVRRLNEDGGRFVTAIPEVHFLQTGSGEAFGRGDPVLQGEPIRFEFARRAARCYSWSGAARLAPAILAPSAVAVSHNPLLRDRAAAGSRIVGYRHADSCLRAARGRNSTSPVQPVGTLVPDLATLILGDSLGSGEYETRADRLLETMVRPHLERAARDMSALRAVRLPCEVWSGSGGLYAPRALGLEVLRRGGEVVRFDHGTPRGFVESAEVTALLELSVSSTFVLATEDAAAICREQNDESLALKDRGFTIRGETGDPTFSCAPIHRGNPSRGRRKRVVYAPTQLLGFRQLLPVQPPDVIYLDWQFRVAECLRDAFAGFICQPHPEGYFRDLTHPLENIVPTIRGGFEAQLESADVFVFDYPSTTALWQAACGDAQIIFLDIEAGRITPAVARLFADRARVIKVDYDDRNRPILDADILCDAVLSEDSPPDPTPFRRLLAGEQ